ncbi:hypothetical protein K7G98_10055 [Saccharothrix sp. MB29]|nr:hypothetical protein [Saccharothrix sp. MB29]
MRWIGKLVAQWMAAGYLSLPAVYLWVSRNDPDRLTGNDFLLINACVAPVAAVWVVLRHRRVSSDPGGRRRRGRAGWRCRAR